MSNNSTLQAKISNKISKSALIGLITYAVVAFTIIILGFIIGHDEGTYLGIYGSYHYNDHNWFFIPLTHVFADLPKEVYPGYIVLTIFIILLLIALPFIYFAISNRKRKLTELSVSNTEVIGSYTAFIPIAKITLRMPIDKIDNVSAVSNFFFLYTGKAIKIRSTSGVIRIPYVENADEVVAFIAAAIEKSRKEQAKPVKQTSEPIQSDFTDSLKKLAELRDAGIISEEEFNQKKNELLGKI